ncbi:putative uncharacterized protein DDB_G0286333 [Sitodiplosis mosellana]|uniref:putative uncharacterized protein DDB_G0286333 n=1 Tax=Sitodiplosis mosellana TaxID=263140 RepID=UPI0024449D6D|nr:putative uncharacterized protein DDB_G0286333 [Sitodiplosis mosellana]
MSTGGSDTAGDIPIPVNKKKKRRSCRDSLTAEKISTSYRLGSVGQDTQLCLWDITEDLLRQSYEKRHRQSSLEPQNDITHPLKEMKITKASDNGNNSNNKMNTFRSKFTVTNDGSGTCTSTSHNTTKVAAVSENTKYSNPNNISKLCSNNSKSTNVMEKFTVKNDSTMNNISSESFSNNKGNNGKSADSGFNTLTQRFSHFNFVNDRKLSSNQQHSHKKTFIFSKSSGSTNNCTSSSKNGNESEKNSKYLNTVVSTYDPMELIGSAACPRFDECPLLEPLHAKMASSIRGLVQDTLIFHTPQAQVQQAPAVVQLYEKE